MKKFFAVTGIIAGSFLVLGGALFGIGFLCGGKNSPLVLSGKGLATDYAYKQDYKEIPAFDTIDMDSDAGNVEIISGDDYAIEYALTDDVFSYTVKDGVLKIKSQRKREFEVSFWDDSYIRIYVPSGVKYNADISNDAGSVKITDVVFDSLTIKCDAGDVCCNGVNAVTLNSDLSAGDFTYDGTCTGSMNAELDMGTARISGFLDCGFNVRADMGSIYVTSYYSSSSYDLDIDVDMGSREIYDNGGKKSDKVNVMKLVCDMGSVDVTFEDEE